MDRLIAIGDIHGCYHTLKKLLSAIEYSSKTDILVFLGDYIDRGYHSYEVVSMIKKLQRQVGDDKVICLMGNHERMAIDAAEKHDTELWYMNGGESTVYSFERNNADMKPYIAWFKSLPLVYDTPEIIFCHAGLSKPLIRDNTQDDLLWGRDWITRDTEEREKQVIFGHTPSNSGHPYTTKTGDICIDTACYYGKNLCAFVITEDGRAKTICVKKEDEDEWV